MSELPSSVQRGVESALERISGRAQRIRSARSLGGGCINPSARIEGESGETFFVKWNDAAPVGMFEAEADGLRALARAGEPSGIRVPEVLAVEEGGAGATRWLLLELVEIGGASGAYGAALGRGLAGVHRAALAGGVGYGWTRDNFIGSLPQTNPILESWADFWRDARLLPQLELARSRGYFQGEDGDILDRLLGRLEDALAGAEAEGPALLHGDLWSGNAYPGSSGEPVLIDPAVYRGHREVDLAMSELFGGFPRGFLEAYHEAWPLAPEYRRVRRPLYQLYYLLVHVNLFGESYVRSSVQAASSVLAAL